MRAGARCKCRRANRSRCKVSVDLVEVSQIVDHDQKFELEFNVFYSWHDPRFAFDAAREGVGSKLIPADDVWNPEPELCDELDVDVRGGKAVRALPDGTLCFSRHYRGTIGGSLDLHEFPLDRHTLEVDLEESVFEADQVVFVPAGVQAIAPDRAVPHGWKLNGVSSEVQTTSNARTGEHYSMLRMNLDVERDPHYYLWAIVLPLIPIVATAWSVFWMHPKEFSSQVTVGITAMLTIVAYRISVDSSLPPLSYMTRMDYFLLACQVFVFGAFLVVVAIHIFSGPRHGGRPGDGHATEHELPLAAPVFVGGQQRDVDRLAGRTWPVDLDRHRAGVVGLLSSVAHQPANVVDGADRPAGSCRARQKATPRAARRGRQLGAHCRQRLGATPRLARARRRTVA